MAATTTAALVRRELLLVGFPGGGESALPKAPRPDSRSSEVSEKRRLERGSTRAVLGDPRLAPSRKRKEAGGGTSSIHRVPHGRARGQAVGKSGS